jgi:K+-transporting ATPase KdpF subunit
MKSIYLKSTELLREIWTEFRPQKLPLYLFLVLGINLILAPVVQGSTGGILTRGQAYALGLLGLVTFSLFIYLFIVIFQPEKF